MSKKIIEQWKKLTPKQKKIAFVLLLILIFVGGYLSNRSKKSADVSLVPNKTVPVVVTAIEEKIFERFIAVQGNLESKKFAMVSPRIAGTIVNFYVEEGDAVVKGRTKLFKTDSVKLHEALQAQKHLLDVEQCARKESVANLEKTEADFYKAELDYHRFERLFDKGAVSADAFEQQQSRYKQLAATVKLAKAAVKLATANVEKVRANMAISQKDLADAVIYAPINGKISYRFKEPGEMGQPGQPVIRIDDTSLIEVSAYMPAQYYSEVVVGKTMIDVMVAGKKIGKFAVSYKSPTVNSKLRTFEVKCLLGNASNTIASGDMAQIRVVLESRQGWAVPSTAIQQRSGKSVIFAAQDDKAKLVEIQTGIENDGLTEIVSSKINQQSFVVSMGQDMLDDGSFVSIQKGTN